MKKKKMSLVRYYLLLKIKNYKYCNKIFIKCMNNTVKLSFKVFLLNKVFVSPVNSIWNLRENAQRS